MLFCHAINATNAINAGIGDHLSGFLYRRHHLGFYCPTKVAPNTQEGQLVNIGKKRSP